MSSNASSELFGVIAVPGMQDFLAQRAIGGGQGLEGRRLNRRGNMGFQVQNAWLPMHMGLNQYRP